MGRGLFHTGKGGTSSGAADWPKLPGSPGGTEGMTGSASVPPPLPQIESANARASTMPATPAEELLERIAAFRNTIGDSLYEISKDYQMLCNLSQADLTACDEIMKELRRRLAGDIHFRVLTKLDDAHALVAAHIGGEA